LYGLDPCLRWAAVAPFHKIEQEVLRAFHFAINAAIGEVLGEAAEAEELSLLFRRGTEPNALYFAVNVNFEMFIHKRVVKVGRCFAVGGIHNVQFRR